MNSRMLERFREYINVTQFNAIKIGLASSEKIRSLSYGEVKKIETINYRTLKPERDGLFCPRIFGPQKDWECNCGKYKRMKHRGVTCEKCGVEVIQARVRRERMGHIELVAPVCHIWYLKGIPSYLSLIFDVPVKDLERVIYFDAYMVIRQSKSPYPVRSLLTSSEYDAYIETNSDDMDFSADMGAEAIRAVLMETNLENEVGLLRDEYAKTASVTSRHKIVRRMKVLSSLMHANLRPEWMVLDVLPVLPPDLRPLVPLEGGRFASSDLNELYRRVLNRNIRLRRLMEISAPSVIIKNEKRMLQEAVDALIDNGRRAQQVRGANRRPLKSLSEMLRGKQGRFRQNLLGRRVDYSGRSVIVVDPELRLDQCGIPKAMALELFKPYVYAGLIKREIAPNMRVARRIVEELQSETWDVLDEVVENRPVLLNRAPTLHRLGIQAFYPTLVDGKAIKIHPLVCNAFNADFDGDQMAVHLPLSVKAQAEGHILMLSSNNILFPATGLPSTVPSQDMVLGLHYITKLRCGLRGEGLTFSSTAEVISAYQLGAVALHARIKVRLQDSSVVDSSAGRVLVYDSLPEGSDFVWINKVLKKRDIGKMVERVYYRFGREATVACLDKVKRLGFYHSTVGGISFSIADLVVPSQKNEIVARADKEVEKIEKLYMDGVITNGERYNKVISMWGHATAEIANVMYDELSAQNKDAFLNAGGKGRPFNPVFMMLESGARGTRDQIKQLVGMRGPMAKPNGEIMETPVKTNFKEGLHVFEYFISTHGARKGQADTALKTANAGYLTRRLVDVAQDVVVTVDDCRTLGFVVLDDLEESGNIVYSFADRAFGRVVAADTKDPVSGELLFKQGHLVAREDVQKIANSSLSSMKVRSVLTCQARRGVCAQCYGYDLSRGELADIGTAVGVIAAQSIGEPGTQLTMRTFHIGGTASGFAAQPYYVAKSDGIVQWRDLRVVKNRYDQMVVMSRKARIAIVSGEGRELQRYNIEYGAVVSVQNGQEIAKGTKIAEWDPTSRNLLTEKAGAVKFVDLVENVTFQERFDEATNKSSLVVTFDTRAERYQPALSILDDEGNEVAHYYLPPNSYLNVTDGQQVEVGDVLVKMPREVSKSKDITTGGLPRIAELFEARTPKDAAIISDIDGEVVIGGINRGMRKVSVVSGTTSFDYHVPRDKQFNVVDSEFVSAGDPLTVGSPVLHDLLRIMGPDVVQKHILNRIQEIYHLQGIGINDRHIETIVRQMMRRVRIVTQGDSDFMIGDRVDKSHFAAVNAVLRAQGRKVATAKPILMGITRASLGTDSFISAASFQETTRILSEAAIAGKVDNLYGLKENVIVGKLVPAGTGIPSFSEKYLGDEISDLEQQAIEEESQESYAQQEGSTSTKIGA